jgi:hypothetical protein
MVQRYGKGNGRIKSDGTPFVNSLYFSIMVNLIVRCYGPILVGLIMVFLITSCIDTPQEKGNSLSRKRAPSLIKPHLLFGDQQYILSFPKWFDSTIVRERKIRRITRKLYPKGISLLPGDEDKLTAQETFQYVFRENGTLKRLIHHSFQFGHSIGSAYYSFQDFRSPNGYFEVKLDSMVSLQEKKFPHTAPRKMLWEVYDELEQSHEYSVLRHRDAKHRLFVVEEDKMWSPLDIDKILSPNAEDWIILGSAEYPKKVYQVENKVKERNVTSYLYRNSSIYQVLSEHYPFYSKRTFQYDQLGHCVSFIDSTFSDNQYLSGGKTTVKYTPSGLPYIFEKTYYEAINHSEEFEVFQYEMR